MNLKPKKNKIIASIFIPIILWITIFFTGDKFPTIFKSFLEIHNFSNILIIGNIFLFIIEFIIVYLIYSFFQSKYSY